MSAAISLAKQKLSDIIQHIKEVNKGSISLKYLTALNNWTVL